MSEQTPPIPNELVKLLQPAGHVAIFTGAGVSAESGVPTFRDGQTGLWANYNPQQLATPQAFQSDPKLVWEWYSWRRELVGQAKPNPGHFALAHLEQQVPKVTLITQNVDSLHAEAGSSNIIHLHGNLHRTICSKERTVVETWADSDEVPPRCPNCQAYLRPDVVWFGEMLPDDALQEAFIAAQTCDIFFSIGTSGLVQPAASLPLMALENDIPTIEINPNSTPLTPQVDFALAGPSGTILPKLIEALQMKS